MRLKLVAWWRSAWRLWSVKLTAFAVALQTFLAAFPDAALQVWLNLPQELKAILPTNFLQWATALVAGASIYARLVQQPKAKAIIDQKLVESGKPSLQEDLAEKLIEGRAQINPCIVLALLLAGMLVSTLTQAQAVVTPTGTFTVSPVTGVGTVTPTLTWDIQNAVSCKGTGVWFTGDKPVKGSENLSAITASAEYTLTCLGPAPAIVGNLPVTWDPPTTNTDGTTLNNLAGYNLYYTNGTKSDFLVRLTNPGLKSYILEDLTPGPVEVSMAALNSAGVSSARTTTVKGNVLGTEVATPSTTFKAVVTVTEPPVPNPPTQLKVVVTTVYRLDQALDAVRLVVVGSVPLGTACDRDVAMVGLYRVNRALVTPKPGYARPNVALAKCGS